MRASEIVALIGLSLTTAPSAREFFTLLKASLAPRAKSSVSGEKRSDITISSSGAAVAAGVAVDCLSSEHPIIERNAHNEIIAPRRNACFGVMR
jgi:hypothetical protein